MAGVQRKLGWTRSAACQSRVHCDWCPFVVDRTETPLGDAHVWGLYPDGEKPGLLARWIAPPGNQCPFGVTFDEAREKRKEQLANQVATNRMKYESAVKAAEAMGLELE